MEKKNIYPLAAIAASLLMYPVLIWSRTTRAEYVYDIVIPVFVILQLFNILAVYSLRPEKRYILVILAMFFVACGDIIINWTPYNMFSPASFAAAHVLFIIFFFKETGFEQRDIKSVFLFLALSGAVVIGTFEYLDSPVLGAGMVVYLGIITLAGWRAVCYFTRKNIPPAKRYMIMAGGVLFYFVDVFSGLRFLQGYDLYILLIWLCYPPALVCLSLANWEWGKTAVDALNVSYEQ